MAKSRNYYLRKQGYRSGLEVDMKTWLESNQIPFTYESQKIGYLQPEKKRTYTPDFIVNGIVIETKGRFVTADRQKHLWIREQHPELDVRFVFYDENAKLSKRSKTSYADWCDKYGFKYCTFKTGIPEEWQKELKKLST